MKKNKVKCMICGKEMKWITIGHLKIHKITIKEYKEKYPNTLIMSDETSKKVGTGMIGRTGKNHPFYGKHHTEESKKKISDTKLGSHLSDKTREKMSKSKTGDRNPMKIPEVRTKHKKIVSSKEHRKKLSESRKKLFEDLDIKKEFIKNIHNPKAKEKQINSLKAYHNKPEIKEEKSKIMLNRWKDEDYRRKQLIAHKDKIGEKASNWQGGISFEPYCYKFNENLRERIRDFFGRCCYICGKNEIDNNNKKLSVHHVNYDKMVCCNDVKPLFVPLCRSCHGRVHYDREYWKEFFTISLEYLTDGECF